MNFQVKKRSRWHGDALDAIASSAPNSRANRTSEGDLPQRNPGTIMPIMGQTLSKCSDASHSSQKTNSQPSTKRKSYSLPISHGHTNKQAGQPYISHQGTVTSSKSGNPERWEGAAVLSKSFTPKHWRPPFKKLTNQTSISRDASESQDDITRPSGNSVTAFKIDVLQVESKGNLITLPHEGMPARMFIAIFYTDDRRKQTELLRDSKICHLRLTADQKIDVCVESFVIPAEKLYVKKKSGSSVHEIIFALPELTTTQIWLETIDFQEAWPLLGSEHGIVKTHADGDLSLNDAALACRSDSLLLSRYHSLDLAVKLSKKSSSTSLCLHVSVEEQFGLQLKGSKPVSGLSTALKSVELNYISDEEAEKNQEHGDKSTDLKENDNGRKNRKLLTVGSDSEDSDKDGEHVEDDRIMEDAVGGSVVRRTRLPRNVKVRYKQYNPKIMFQEILNPAPNSVPSRVSSRKRKSRTGSETHEDNDRGVPNDGPSRTNTRKRVRRVLESPEKQEEIRKNPQPSPAKTKPSRVPKSRRPLYTITNRRMLLVGDELHSSDDEADDDWLLQREIYAINDFTDVTDEEKEFCVKWNVWTMQPGNDCSSGTYLQENLIRFCAENQEWFLLEQSRVKEMCKFWKVAHDRSKEVTFQTWVECLKYLEPDSGLWDDPNKAQFS